MNDEKVKWVMMVWDKKYSEVQDLLINNTYGIKGGVFWKGIVTAYKCAELLLYLETYLN